MQTPEKKKRPRGRRRSSRIGAGLASIITVLALLCGGALGYIIGANRSSLKSELADANARIEELEFTMMEMYSDTELTRADTPAEGFDDGNSELSGGIVSDIEGADTVVVAEFTGGVIMSDEAEAEYSRRVSGFALGGADTTELSRSAIYSSVLEDMVGDRVARLKAEELGFTTLSEADEQLIAERAQTAYEEQISFYVDFVRESGMSDEEAREATMAYLLASEGVSLDSVTQAMRDDFWKDKLYEHVTGGISVTADDITGAYAEQLDAQKALFAEDYGAFESAVESGDLILYYPEGLRLVKRMFFSLDVDSAARLGEIDAELGTLDAGTDAGRIAELTTERDALFADCEARAATALSKLEGGGDFAAVAAEYSNSDSYTESGMYVSERSTVWPEDFISACMAISAPGDYSPVVRTGDGVSIILYASTVEVGAVPLSTVNAEMTEATRASAEFEAYEQALQTWTQEASPVYYVDRISQ